MAAPISILITGPESSGKSTLSKQLAEKLNVNLATEYARDYLSKLTREYTENDLDKIALGQYEREKKSLNSNSEHVVLDTGPIVLNIWNQVKYSTSNPFIENWIEEAKYDFVFLCNPEFPWQFDPLREHPTKQKELYKMYQNKLQELDWNYNVLSGSEQKRLQCALDLISKTKS